MNRRRVVAEWILIGLCTVSLISYVFWSRPVETYLSLLATLVAKTLALAGM
jgi:hypothetical protein